MSIISDIRNKTRNSQGGNILKSFQSEDSFEKGKEGWVTIDGNHVHFSNDGKVDSGEGKKVEDEKNNLNDKEIEVAKNTAKSLMEKYKSSKEAVEMLESFKKTTAGEKNKNVIDHLIKTLPGEYEKVKKEKADKKIKKEKAISEGKFIKPENIKMNDKLYQEWGKDFVNGLKRTGLDIDGLKEEYSKNKTAFLWTVAHKIFFQKRNNDSRISESDRFVKYDPDWNGRGVEDLDDNHLESAFNSIVKQVFKNNSYLK